jgi:hypothetical protein
MSGYFKLSYYIFLFSFIHSFSLLPLPVPNSLSGLRKTDTQEEKQGCHSHKNGVRGLDVGYGGGGLGKALISVKLTTFIPRIPLSLPLPQ